MNKFKTQENKEMFLIYNSKYENEINKLDKYKKFPHHMIGKLLGYSCPRNIFFKIPKKYYSYGIKLYNYNTHNFTFPITYTCNNNNKKHIKKLQYIVNKMKPIVNQLNTYSQISIYYNI